jgi:hypothetical protein
MKIKSCRQQLFTQWKSLFTFTDDNFWKLDISAGSLSYLTLNQLAEKKKEGFTNDILYFGLWQSQEDVTFHVNEIHD